MMGRRQLWHAVWGLVTLCALPVSAPGATIRVTTCQDDSNAGDGECTLREAINNANENSDTTAGDCEPGEPFVPPTPITDIIVFTIPCVGLQAIRPASPLPDIEDPVVIDGTDETEPDEPPCTGVPDIELDGTMAGTGATGLTIAAGGGSSTVCGLVINRFWRGIVINGGSDGNVIRGNYIGTDVTGTAPLDNGASGIEVFGSNNTIGGIDGTTPGGSCTGACNIVSNSSGAEIGLSAGFGNLVAGNFVGVDITGTVPMTRTSGVVIAGGSDHRIGGVTPNARNVIGAGDKGGVHIRSGTTENVVLGNFIGMKTTGDERLDIDAHVHGVLIDGLVADASANVIGGSEGTTPWGGCTGACNLISGNRAGGVRIQGSFATYNVVQGNYIGTDFMGGTSVGPLGQNINGVLIERGASDNLIGGSESGQGNLITGHSGPDVVICGEGTSENQVQGNRIGTDAGGLTRLPGRGQVAIENASNNFVGGPGDGEGNLIAGGTAVQINCPTVPGGCGDCTPSSAGNNVVQGNLLGTNASGTGLLTGEASSGGGVSILNSPNNLIGGIEGTTPGGPCTGACNVISGHDGGGVVIIESGATGNRILGNYIGTDITGTVCLGNSNSDGVNVRSRADDNIIGGPLPGEGNIIACHDAPLSGSNPVGVRVSGEGDPETAPTGITIRGNSIHSNEVRGIENQNGGNRELCPPVIVSGPPISGTVCGDCGPACIIDVYSDDEAEGRVYQGATIADSAGNWAFLDPVSGPNVTATATDAEGNTSEFSVPFECGVDGPCCGDGACDPPEDICNCSADCGTPPTGEFPATTCEDGVDNDCDGLIDSDDPDCGGQAIPTVSEWGLVIMTLLLLTGAKVYFGRRQEAVTGG